MTSLSKMLLFAMTTLMTSQFSWAQQHGMGAILSVLDKKPVILELDVITSWTGESKIMHIQEKPFMTIIQTLFIGDKMLDFNSRILKANLGKIYCDGNYEFAYDSHGTQHLSISSINVCLDEDGWVVAHSFGRPNLDPVEIVQSTRKILENRSAKKVTGAIYEGQKFKDIDEKTKIVSDGDPLQTASQQ